MIRSPFAATLALTLCALQPTGAAAQETLILSPCQDGLNGGASYTSEEIGRALEGSWRMVAAGTGFTTGTSVMAVSLRYDAASDTLRMEGGGGPSVALMPVVPDDAGGDNAPFDMSVEALTPLNLTAQEYEILSECAAPARYYWELSMGGQRSWGGLMFHDLETAVGFMANSAGGSRHVQLAR